MFQFFPMMQHYTRQAGRPGFSDESAVDPDSPFNPVNHSQEFGLVPAALAGGEQDMLARVRQARKKGWGR